MRQVSADALTATTNCGRLGYFYSFGSDAFSNPHAVCSKEITKAIKKVIIDYLLSRNNRTVTLSPERFGEMLDNKLFYAPWQKEQIVNQCIDLIKRFISWPNWCEYEVIQGNFTQVVQLGEAEISIAGDFVLRHHATNKIIICKIVKNAPTLSSHARANEENKPYNSFTMACLHLAGKILYPNNEIATALFHLKGKDDKANDIVEEYDYKPGKNIIYQEFTPGIIDTLASKANTLLPLISLRNAPDCRRNNKCTECSYFSFCKSLLVSAETIVSEEEAPDNFEVQSDQINPTPEQKAVIDADNGIFAVNAAAGCGKTMVLVLRIFDLLKKGVDPSKILAITFTKKAAEELKKRVKKLCKSSNLDIDCDALNINTFNAFGSDVLKTDAHFKLLNLAELKLAEKIDLFGIIFEICEGENLDAFKNISSVDLSNPVLQFMNKKGIVPYLWEYFNKIKVHHWKTVEDIEVGAENDDIISHEQATTILRLYNKYVAKLKESGKIEYQDQINYVLDLFENFPEVKSRYQFNHIMVDEYQDTDNSQVLLLKHLLDNGFDSFMVVGDDAQAIYAFRLADYTNILRFKDDFAEYGEVTSLKITQNFRSTTQILNLGNEINHNHNENDIVLGKDLVGDKEGEKPKLITVSSEAEEFELVATKIEELVNSGSPYGDIAIIARTRNELNRLSWFLEEKNIPYTIRLSKPLIQEKEVIAIKCIAETLSDTDSRFSYLTALAIQEDSEELLDLSVADLYQYIDNKIKSLDFPEDLSERLIYFFNYCDTIFKSQSARKLLKMIKEQEFENFAQVNSYLTEMFDFEDGTSIEDEVPESANAVTLITAHTAKGKEWENVILLLDQFANSTRNKNEYSIAEERRLLFVSVTRARNDLYMLQFNPKTYDFITEMKPAVDLFMVE